MAQITIDSDIDCAYVLLSDGAVAYSKRLDERRIVDYAEDGSPRGIELLYVSDGVDLHDLPDEAVVGRLLEEHGIKSLAA